MSDVQIFDLRIVEADLDDKGHQQAILLLLDAYAQDPVINGKPLDVNDLEHLIDGLQRHPTTIVLLAYHDSQPVGLAVCFVGFSTFAAKPLINIHDLAVLAEHRGRGVGQRLLAAIESKAKALGCCRVTLEVYEDNQIARAVYQKVGFGPTEQDPGSRRSLFMCKQL